MNFFYENGRGGNAEDSRSEAADFVIDLSFRFTKLTNIHKYTENKKVPTEIISLKTLTCKRPKEKRTLIYNIYTDEDHLRCLYSFKRN